MKPANKAPKKPEPPVVARKPPTIPGMRAGRSPILIAMYPAKIGIIMLKAKPPTFFKNAASGVPVPKFAVPALPISKRNAKAMRIPPPMTKGSI